MAAPTLCPCEPHSRQPTQPLPAPPGCSWAPGPHLAQGSAPTHPFQAITSPVQPPPCQWASPPPGHLHSHLQVVHTDARSQQPLLRTLGLPVALRTKPKPLPAAPAPQRLPRSPLPGLTPPWPVLSSLCPPAISGSGAARPGPRLPGTFHGLPLPLCPVSAPVSPRSLHWPRPRFVLVFRVLLDPRAHGWLASLPGGWGEGGTGTAQTVASRLVTGRGRRAGQ